jgi:hypothetical protein
VLQRKVNSVTQSFGRVNRIPVNFIELGLNLLF